MPSKKEASARIKINKLLEEAGWRFEDNQYGPANIQLEVSIKTYQNMGDDFEHAQSKDKQRGAIDFLLLDKDKRPLVVVEAKKESLNPLSAKEQARTYARSIQARYIILSNGNSHYLWDTLYGNPHAISRFPSQESLSQAVEYHPSPIELAKTFLDEYYIIESQMPDFRKDPSFLNPKTCKEFLDKHHLKKLRSYQLQAIKSLQEAAKQKKQRFLFEMATGTGKTLVSAAVIKLFLQSGNAQRVLFLVDRLELEDQAFKAFTQYLGKDYTTMIYKDNRDSWTSAHIVVSTIQTFLSGDRYRKEFSPTDFELVISDEAHRSIGGNSRVVFEYFVGYKLGLTATPKDYLKGFEKDSPQTQREFERRVLLDTYKTFGCDSGIPTFRYDLIAGVKDGYLINPIIIDARTEITTQLLSDEGLSIRNVGEDSIEEEQVFTERDYEKKVFNDQTNVAMCKAFLDHALQDPISRKMGYPVIGKSIIFCVSQAHAARITQILNQLAFEKWPQQFHSSDFAVQVTSNVYDAQQKTINFANNNLNGHLPLFGDYETSKTRICVTVSMMTTGYDCQDILNLALMRPIFSPSLFVQMKGRGTRTFTFTYIDEDGKTTYTENKTAFKLFDYFATCEYFEEEFDYDEKISLPSVKKDLEDLLSSTEKNYDPPSEPVNLYKADKTIWLKETPVGFGGLKIDREMFRKAMDEDVVQNPTLHHLWKTGNKGQAEEFTKKNILNHPKHFLNLEKIRQAFNIDRRITIREFLEMAFGEIEEFPGKNELLEKEWEKFVSINPIDQELYYFARSFFRAYITDPDVREIIDSKKFGELHTRGSLDFDEYRQLGKFKTLIPTYIKDYISLNIFMD